MGVNVDSETENLNAKNDACQLNAISTQQCVIDDGAPDYRANKCSLGNSGRRRMLSVHNTMMGVQCKYSRMYIRTYVVMPLRIVHTYMDINHIPEW